jgi:hypothetical protein
LASKSIGGCIAFAAGSVRTLGIAQGGVYTRSVKPKADPRWKVIGLKSVTLHPAPQ